MLEALSFVYGAERASGQMLIPPVTAESAPLSLDLIVARFNLNFANMGNDGGR
jgi:hypothetical protein